jgi:hypothetical protein
MRAPNLRTPPSLAVRLAAGAAVAGVTCIVAGLFIAYLIADHSSSDSSPSSLTAIGLGVLGVLLVLVSAVLFIGHGLRRLRRWVRRPPHDAQGSR